MRKATNEYEKKCLEHSSTVMYWGEKTDRIFYFFLIKKLILTFYFLSILFYVINIQTLFVLISGETPPTYGDSLNYRDYREERFPTNAQRSSLIQPSAPPMPPTLMGASYHRGYANCWYKSCPQSFWGASATLRVIYTNGWMWLMPINVHTVYHI